METAKAIKYQMIRLTIPAPGATVNFNTNSDKMYKRITGILLSSPYILSYTTDSTFSLTINEKEIFPEGFEVRLLSVDPNVPPNERFFQLDEPADGSTIKGKFIEGVSNVVVYPFTFNIYLKLEEKQY